MKVLSYWTNFDTGWGWVGGRDQILLQTSNFFSVAPISEFNFLANMYFLGFFQSVLKLSVDKLCFLSDESCVCEYKYQFSPFPLLCTVVKQMPPRCWRSCSVVLPL